MPPLLNLTPRAAPTHWSARYLGLPWAPGAEGPQAFDCWGLARHVQRVHYGRPLPQLRVAALRTQAGPAQTRALLELVRRSGWRLLDDWYTMADGDLLRMQSSEGPHIGTVVQRRPGAPAEVLQAVGRVDEHGRSHGAVEVALPHQLVAEGFGRFQAWRWTAAQGSEAA